MANKVIVTRSKLDSLAESISNKSGAELPLTIAEMIYEVDNLVLNTQIIQVGSGAYLDENNNIVFVNGDGESATLGTKTITANGTYNASSDSLDGYSSVTVNVSSQAQPTQTKIVTPTESQQTILPDSGYLLSSVTVNAISSTYVGSGITSRDDSDLEISWDTVTVPSGYYENSCFISIPSITHSSPSISVNTTTGLITATHLQSQSGYLNSGTTTTTEQLTIQAAKTVTPTETEQTAVAANVYTTGIVKVGAISSTYVGSEITQRDDTDLIVSGATVTVPSGYYADNETKTVASGSASTPATTIIANPSITVSSSGLITATTSASQSVTPTVSAGYVSSGTVGTVTVSGSNNSQLTTKGATTYNTSTTDQTIASGTYLTGTQTIKGVTVSGLDASKILSGTTVMVGDANDADRIASVSGSVTFSTVIVSSSAPSGGNFGDIWIQV